MKQNSGMARWMRWLDILLVFPLMDLPDSTLPGKSKDKRRKKLRKLEMEVEDAALTLATTDSKRKRRVWFIYGKREEDDSENNS